MSATSQVQAYGLELWVIIAGMALVTYLNRAGFFLLPPGTGLPPAIQRALRFAPAAALAAIVLPDLFVNAGNVDLSLANVRLYAGGVGFAAALATRSTLIGIVVGMTALHLFRHFV